MRHSIDKLVYGFLIIDTYRNKRMAEFQSVVQREKYISNRYLFFMKWPYNCEMINNSGKIISEYK